MNLDKYLVTKVSWCYYMENMTQEQIAKEFGITRFKVIKMLEQARQEKIVQFHINGAGVNCMQIEKKLVKAYNLSDAFVVPGSNDTINSLAIAASFYLENKITDDDVIGFGWGQTISKTISKIKLDYNIKASFISLTGGVKYYIPYLDNEDCSPDSLKAKLYVIPSPFFLSSEEMAVRMRNEPSVKVIFDLAKTANYLLVGIGPATDDATVLKESIITHDQMGILRRKGAVGDILGQFYNSNGEKINTEIHKRIMSLDINSLKEKKNVIGVAGGDEKVEPIKGALKGGYLNVLITDEPTAEKLLG